MGLIHFYEKMKKVTKVMGAISAIALAAIMLFTIVITVFRYILKIPILGSNELVEVTLSICRFACMAYAQSEKAHVNLFLFLLKLPKKAAMIMYSVDMVLATAASIFITYGFLQQGQYAYRKGLVTVLRGLPLYVFYFIGFACFCVFSFVLLLDTIIAIRGVRNPELEEYTRSTW